MLLIPTVYAICKCDIEVESTIEIERLPKIYDTLVGISEENNSCITKYNGEVTDEVGKTVPATNVYFDKCSEQRNVIFGGFCWQVIRTTETKGTKLIYNGEPVNGKCEKSRGLHKGVSSTTVSSQALNDEYLYGNSFTYDTSTKEFTLVDTEKATWSDSTYEKLIGMFTCKNITGTCTTLYNINGYLDNTTAYLVAYGIFNTFYSQIGSSPFNINAKSPAMVGYMFNKVYNNNSKKLNVIEYKYGNSFTYDPNYNTYTLSGTTQNISDWSTGYNQLNNTHYTCWNTTGVCDTISYIYATTPSYAYYIDLTGGKNERDSLEEMLLSDDVNRYNSSIKGIVDAWYVHNLSSKTNMLEDTIYCNARNITNYGGWNPNGGSTTEDAAHYLKFKNYTSITNLACPNITDQFAVSNNKSKLTYPIGLLQIEESNNVKVSSMLSAGNEYWSISPYIFYDFDARIWNTYSSGGFSIYDVDASSGIRPVVSLAYGNVISSGTGSENDPWIIE